MNLRNLIVIAGRNKNEAAPLGAKYQSNVRPGSALKIISAKSLNAQARVQMRFTKTSECRVNRASNFSAARLASASCARKVFKSSICKIGFEISGVSLDCSLFSLLSDPSIHPLHKLVELLIVNCVLAQRVIIRANCDRTQRDYLIAMQNSDVLAFGGSLQKRREIAPGLGRRKGLHASILRRYGEQLNCHSDRRNSCPFSNFSPCA
jgi:hypothetical protein